MQWLSEAGGLTLPRGFAATSTWDAPRNRVLRPDALRRSIINLHENACHALNAKRQRAPAADLVLTLQTRLAADRLELRIADSGIGIKPDILPRIFEPLFSTKGFGVGLGLVIVRKIMQRHAGGVEISSVEGEGTQVMLWLPRSV